MKLDQAKLLVTALIDHGYSAQVRQGDKIIGVITDAPSVLIGFLCGSYDGDAIIEETHDLPCRQASYNGKESIWY